MPPGKIRLIECDQDTERVLCDSDVENAYQAWELAQESIWTRWDHFTDLKNLQPKVRKLNREVENFLVENPPTDVDQKQLDRIFEIVLSPWPRREENRLREVWIAEHSSNTEKASALIKAVTATGIEPFEAPDRFPKIDKAEVRLVCWLAIQAVADT